LFNATELIMLNQIILNTPRWVWVLLVALLGLGFSQALARTASLKRITLMPVVMTGLSLSGVVGAFGAGAPLLAWLVACVLTAASLARQALPEATRYDPATRNFSLPGSWVPLALILGIFMTKYFVGVATAMQPALAREWEFALGFSALYGVFSAVFLARTWSLWRLALKQERVTPSQRALAA
jgi:hypothetical protein